MGETVPEIKPIEESLEIKGQDGGRTDQSLLKARKLERLKEMGCCFLPRDGLQIHLDKRLRMNLICSCRDASENVVVNKVRRRLSMD